MSNCEMCGAEARLFPTLVEGVELLVCKNCSGFGKRIKKPMIKSSSIKRTVSTKLEREIIQVIVNDYARLIRERREKMGLKQKEFAKFIAERESIIHKLESGTYKPSIELARKLEKQLGIRLIEEKEVRPQNIKASPATFTIGDIIKIKS